MRDLRVRKAWHLAVCVAALALLMAPGGLPARADTFFPQTGFTVWGPFETYWKAHGGLSQFGMPRTNVYPGGQTYDAQWFERALFTYNPAKPDPYKVELQLLGSMATADRRNEAPFRPAPAMMSPGAEYFTQTQHNLSGKFLQYWQAKGGLAIYGYPISEAFEEQSRSDGKIYTVQYFERNRFEYHPELAGTAYEVQLGLLGSELLDKAGGPAAFANKGAPGFYPPPAGSSVPPGGVVDSPGAGGSGSTGGQNSVVPPAPALPPTTSPVLFSADFSGSSLAGWQPVTLTGPAGSSPAPWSVRSGILMQSEAAPAQSGANDDAFIVTVGSSFRDFVFDAELYATSGEAIGVVFRQGPGGFYWLRLQPQLDSATGPRALLSYVPGGPASTLASSSTWTGYKPGAWTRVTIRAVGSSINVSLNGEPVFTASDSHLSQGAVGLYAFADGSARFDNVRVTQP